MDQYEVDLINIYKLICYFHLRQETWLKNAFLIELNN